MPPRVIALRIRIAPREIPATELLEAAKRLGAVIAAARGARVLEQVEVVAYEPDPPSREQAVEEVGADFVVGPAVYGLSHVVKERGGPHHTVFGRPRGVLEDLQRVKERVAFRMVAG